MGAKVIKKTLFLFFFDFMHKKHNILFVVCLKKLILHPIIKTFFKNQIF